MHRGAERLTALGLGALAGTAWQPLAWWPAIFVALAGFGWLVLNPRAARADDPRAAHSHDPRARRGVRGAVALGWLFGLGLGLVSLSWVHVIGWYVVPPLLALMACWQALVAACLVASHRITGNPLLLAVMAACAWSLSEFGAGRLPFGGFAWMRLAWTQVDSPLAGWLPLIGAGGLSFVVALVSHLVAVVVTSLRSSRATSLTALLAAAALAIGGPIAARVVPVPDGDDGVVNIGMVQGNVDGSPGPNAMGYARSVTDNHVSQTVTLMARSRAGLDPMPDFVLWPENATDIDPTKDDQTHALVQRASRIAGLPILVGAVMDGPGLGKRQTSALWWTTEGTIAARYDKRNLVPFGEWIPLRAQLLPVLPVLREVGAQSIPGTTPGVLHVTLPDGRPLAVGDVVCFELAWDRTVRETVTHGAQVLVVQSNNGTYTGTGQPRQQFAITRARAMELRRDIVVATTNSLSARVHPDGRVSGLTREAMADARTFTVPVAQGTTPAVVAGPLIERAASLLAVLGLVVGVLAGRSRVGDAGRR